MQGDHRTRLAASLLFAGGTLFLIMNTVAEAMYPNYSVGANALSDLGALGAPTRFLWDGQLFATGVLALAGIWILFFKSSWTQKVGVKNKNLVSVIYLLPAVASILVSLFPENYIPVVHSLSALITFVMGGVSALYAYRFTSAPYRYFSVALGAISLVSLALLATGARFGFGLGERLVVYPFVLWVITFGSYLMAKSW